MNERGGFYEKSHPFEGILHNLERRYRETDSLMVREELAKYLNACPCPECGGTRLRKEARHVRVASIESGVRKALLMRTDEASADLALHREYYARWR